MAFMLRRPPYFNSRTRVWCDRICSAQGNRSFQLTHPVRGATIASDVQPCNIFQLPHPVRGATQTIMCFPPHIQKLALKFSILAPHEGYDRGLRGFRQAFHISTPAPAWGATIQTAVPFLMAWYFQLTHPMRGATEAFAPAEGYFSFQLAHPVRGATRREPVIFLPSAISTPAPHEGCDWNFRATRPWSEFQLTHSMHGCDRHGRVWRRETCHFNSRTRVGCDKIKWYTINTPKISTPAPHVGCDPRK